MANQKSVRSNAIYNSIFQLLVYIIPLITTPYVSRVLGAEHVGQYSYALSIATYFWLIAVLGSSTHGQRAIAYCRDDKSKCSEQFWNIFFFRVITTSISLLFYYLVLSIIGELSILQIIVSLHVLNVLFDVSWFFQGLEDFKKTATRGFLIKILGLIGIFLFVKSQDDTWKYALVLMGSSLIGNLILWFNVPDLVFKPQRIRPFYEIKDIILVFLPTVASQVYMVLDKSMIGWITQSDYENGCYEQSEKLVRVVVVLISAVSSVVLPRVANLFSLDKIDEAKEFIYKAYRVVFLLSIPLFYGLLTCSSLFIPIYLGRGFELSIPLMQIFSWLVVVVSLASVTGLAYLVSTKQQNIYTISVSLAAIVNVLMNIVLIPSYGAMGAAIASITAETIGAVFQICYCVKKKQLSLNRIIMPSWKYFLSGTIMFFILLILRNYINVGYLGLLLLVLTGVIVYVLLLVAMKDSFFIQQSKSLVNHLIHNKKSS